MYPGHWAKVVPDKAAVIDSATGARRTYGELNDRSNQLAQFLFDKGLRRGDHISIFAENHLSWFDIVWAALRSGLYLTTINRYLADEEAGYILDNSGSQALIASRARADVAASLHRFAPACRTWLMLDGAVDGYLDFEQTIAEYAAEPLAEEPAGRTMLYSSGTTGRPKGVLRPLPDAPISEDAGPLRALLAKLWSFDENTVYLSPAPLYHAAPLGFSAYTQSLGGTVVYMPRFDAARALQAIEDHGVTHSQWVPTMFSRMLKLDASERRRYDLSSHRVAIHAAAPCPPRVKEQMFEWWGKIIHEYYGGTEINGFTHAGPDEWLQHRGTVGKPITGAIRICGDDGAEVPVGETGVVYFEMPATTFEYLNEPEKTRDAQHAEHSDWITLGDVGHVDADGYLYLTDRATYMIISGGVNIYPQEVENALILHPKVLDVAVIGAPDEEMGEEVRAVVQPAEGAVPGSELEAELIAYARENIAHYKCPKAVDFRDELPRLPTGKLYKRFLRDEYWGRRGSRIV